MTPSFLAMTPLTLLVGNVGAQKRPTDHYTALSCVTQPCDGASERTSRSAVNAAQSLFRGVGNLLHSMVRKIAHHRRRRTRVGDEREQYFWPMIVTKRDE